jgi:hypothetical protein
VLGGDVAPRAPVLLVCSATGALVTGIRYRERQREWLDRITSLALSLPAGERKLFLEFLLKSQPRTPPVFGRSKPNA